LELVVVITPATVTASTLVIYWKSELFSGCFDHLLALINPVCALPCSSSSDPVCIVDVAIELLLWRRMLWIQLPRWEM